MILVTSATGNTGRHIVHNLVNAGVPVRAMTRDPDRARALPGFDRADLVVGDPAQPDSLAAAFAGAEKVMLTPPAAPGWVEMQDNLIAAARRAGVAHIVKLSVVPILSDPFPWIFTHHLAGERAIEASGIAWTHLRPHSFMQNIPGFFLPLSGSDGTSFTMCTGDGRMPLIDARDVADVATVALTTAGHEGRAYTLTGPEALTFAEAAARIQAATGRPLRYVDKSRADYVAGLIGMGFPDVVAISLGDMYGTQFREGRVEQITDTVQAITGRPARAIDEFARDWAAGRA